MVGNRYYESCFFTLPFVTTTISPLGYQWTQLFSLVPNLSQPSFQVLFPLSLSEFPSQPHLFHFCFMDWIICFSNHRIPEIRLTSSQSEGAGQVQPIYHTAFLDLIWRWCFSSHIPNSHPPQRAFAPTSHSCIPGRNFSHSKSTHFLLNS